MFDLKRIGIVKRASAWLLDAILIAVLATGFMWLIGLICNFEGQQALANEYYTEWSEYQKEYGKEIAEHFGFSYEEAEDGTVAIAKDGQSATIYDVFNALEKSNGAEEEMREAYDALLALTPGNQVNAQYDLVFNILFMMVSLGLLLAFLILEFIVPIFLKNGQTVGKKIFGICLVRPDCIKITTLSLFARSVLGKYAIETMFPVLLVFLFLFGRMGWLAVALFAAIILLNVILFFATRNRTPIHDILAYTAAADMRTQMIYESEEELNAKKAQLFQEKPQRNKT